MIKFSAESQRGRAAGRGLFQELFQLRFLESKTPVGDHEVVELIIVPEHGLSRPCGGGQLAGRLPVERTVKNFLAHGVFNNDHVVPGGPGGFDDNMGVRLGVSAFMDTEKSGWRIDRLSVCL